MSRELYNYKRNAIKAANDFNYPKEVIEAIKAADSVDAISNIMSKARNTYL